MRLERIVHVPLLVLPNILNPYKLVTNLRHPIHEVLHSQHEQYPIGDQGLHVVKHEFLGRVVTVDLIKETEFAEGFIPRLRQLFSRDFYYGHCEYFPRPFRLVDRSYMSTNGGDFDQHVRNL